MKKNQKKNIAIFAFSFLAMIGTYNAVMINSESVLGDSRNFKHLDEVYGSAKTGRSLALATNWKKISPSDVKNFKTAEVAVAHTNSEAAPVATIQENLAMKLVEVINPKKWSKGVSATDFSGSIETNNGVIEALNASLPDNNSIEISFSEMNGNTFEYDLNGEVYSAMMYQVDQSSYMVTMTNGPLEGTRMRFASEAKTSESQNDYLSETHKIEVQNFGSESESQVAEASESVATETAEVASYNFNI